MRKHVASRVLLIIAAINIGACAESNFELAPESRLPKWFETPSGMPRDQVRVTVDYYVYPTGRKAVFKLYYKNGFFSVKKVTGVLRGLDPIHLKDHPVGFPEHLPAYEVVTVNGIADIVEHRERKPIFNMTDDPAVWKELGVEKK